MVKMQVNIPVPWVDAMGLINTIPVFSRHAHPGIKFSTLRVVKKTQFLTFPLKYWLFKVPGCLCHVLKKHQVGNEQKRNKKHTITYTCIIV